MERVGREMHERFGACWDLLASGLGSEKRTERMEIPLRTLQNDTLLLDAAAILAKEGLLEREKDLLILRNKTILNSLK